MVKVSTSKGKKGSGLMAPMLVSEALQNVINKKECSRADSMKYVWEYIKKNNLQDAKDKRTIVPDKTLSEVLGKKPIGMMKIAGLVFKQLSDKK